MIISDSKGGTVATGIDRLYDYTKFHVGLYISLVFGVVALISIGNGEALRNSIVLMFAIFAIMSWVVSGFAGGVILGTLVDQNCSLKKFQESKWGPSGAKWMTGRSWESLEHYSFWVGVVLALTAFTFAVFFILSPPDVAAVIDTESHKCI